MRLFQKLYGGLQCFFMLSTRYAVLFRALNPLLLKLSSADCSQIWRKTLPGQGRQVSAGPGREASLFRVAGASFFTRDTKNCPLSAQQPLDACRRPLHCLDKMIAGIQLKHGVDAVALVKGPDFLGILPDWFQNRVAGPGLLVPREK